MIVHDAEFLKRLVAVERTPIFTDSRAVAAKGVFVALPVPSHHPDSTVRDGGEFIGMALKAGAGYIVCTPERAARLTSEEYVESPAVLVPSENPHALLGDLAAALYDTRRGLEVYAVTGTNGKTTVTYLLEHLFTAAGGSVGVLGTVNYRWPGHVEPSALTTPGALAVHEYLHKMRDAGASQAVLEASSHALDQQRLAGVEFSGAIFTNLTQDHLDYHADMEDYFAAKARLFLTVPRFAKALAINADDAFGRRLLRSLQHAVGFGLKERPEWCVKRRFLQGEVIEHSVNGLRMRMQFASHTWELASPLVGLFNASNLLAAQAMGMALGLPPEQMNALAKFTGVPGRLERVANPRNLHVFVDYAHTPDALVNVLTAVRAAGFKRVITVFGCGGDRDKTKRPLMGKAVAEYADVAVLTSDNPRTEEPRAIMADVLPGLTGAKQLLQEVDRKQAIKLALDMLGPADALLIAGKGHEDYQIINKTKVHFSDQETVREFLC